MTDPLALASSVHENSQTITSSAVLDVRCLNYTASKKTIINELSFVIEREQTVAVVGLNGAGKSSLIKLLVAEIIADSGQILWKNNDIGYQACNMQALDHLTSYEYLLLCCSLKKMSRQLSEIEIAKVSKRWQLGSILNKPMQILSQGNLQKLAIAQAFLLMPQVVLLDEPTQALDPVAQQLFKDNLNQIKGQILCLFSSHHISEVVESADQVLMMDQGKLIASIDLTNEFELWFTTKKPIDIHLVEQQNANVKGLKIKLHFHNNAYLYSINSSSLSQNQKILELISATTQVEILGSVSQTLMPLFNLLSNQRL